MSTVATRFRRPTGRNPYALLLDRQWRTGGRDVLDVPADLSLDEVIAAAEPLIEGPADRLDLAVEGRLTGVVTMSSLLTARHNASGTVRGDRRQAPARSAAERPPVTRLVCGECSAVVHMVGSRSASGSCPSGHPLAR